MKKKIKTSTQSDERTILIQTEITTPQLSVVQSVKLGVGLATGFVWGLVLIISVASLLRDFIYYFGAL